MPRATPSLLTNRNWRLLFAGSAVSYLGDVAFDITVMMWITSLLGADHPLIGTASAAILWCVMVPVLVIGPVAGAIVDTWPKQRTMIVGNALQGLLIGLLVLVAWPGTPLPQPLVLSSLYAVLLLTNIVSQFFLPASTVLSALCVPEPDRTTSAGYFATMRHTVTVGAPLVAGAAFVVGGPLWGIALNAVSFLVSALLLTRIRYSEPAAPARTSAHPFRRVLGDLRDGVTEIRRNPVLRLLAVIMLALTVTTAPLNTLSNLVVIEANHAPLSMIPVWATCAGAAGIAGSVFATAVSRRWTSPTGLIVGALGGGLGLLALSLSVWFPFGAAMIMVGIATATIFNIFMGPVIMRATPPSLLGRISSSLGALAALGTLSGGALASTLVDGPLKDVHLHIGPLTYGRVHIVLFVGALLLLACMPLVWRSRRIPEFTATADPPPSTPPRS